MNKLLLLLVLFPASVFGQESKLVSKDFLYWRDIYDCDFSKGIINPDSVIICDNFFQLKDSATVQAFVMWNWTSQPGILNLDSAANLISYPKDAERYKISGSVFIRVLVDKTGNILLPNPIRIR